MGGRVPGSNAADSTEIFQEGLRIPPLKLYRRGEPDEAMFLKRLAEAQLQNGMIKAARQSSERMIRLAPDDEDSFELCGQICLELEDYKEAEKYFPLSPVSYSVVS